jgi:3-hydroxybutyryl-CoA dehydrogenase
MATPPVIAALGAGRMGRGIAHAFAYAGHEVRLIDLKERNAADAARVGREAIAEVDASLRSLADLGTFDADRIPAILARIRFVPLAEAPAALADAEVAFEGVPEVLADKAKALGYACAHLPPDAIVASTTSTFLVTTVADFVTRPERFLNAHWLNPAYLIPLVELSPHAGTDAAVTERLKSLLEGIGKVPVVCAAAPGYIVPRFQSLLMNEAARMVEEGLATPDDIDKAVRFGLGFRYANMGVVEFIDYGGVDILHYASGYLERTLDPRFKAPAIVGKLMGEGRRGLREGQGFYDWTKVDVPTYRRDALARLVAMLKHLDLVQPPR